MIQAPLEKLNLGRIETIRINASYKMAAREANSQDVYFLSEELKKAISGLRLIAEAGNLETSVLARKILGEWDEETAES
jgi:hypothetical protein